MPRPSVIDTDLGVDDVIALAMLLQDPRADVRAVTVSGTGLVHCPGGARLVRSLVAALGENQPVGCGRDDAGPDGLAFPQAWRAAADDMYGLELPRAEEDSAARDAAAVMQTAISSSRRRVTIVASGPWTNLEDLVRRSPNIAGRVAEIHAMAGAIDVPGNVEVTDAPVAEWNVRADPSAFATVLQSDIPVTLVPLDATDAVPLARSFLDRLAEDQSSPAANLAWRLLSRNPFLFSTDQYLWDELAAISLLDPSLVRTHTLRVAVDTAEPDAGRIVRSDSGAEVRAAFDADGARAVDAIIDALQGDN